MLEVSLSAFLHAYTGELSLGGELRQRRRTVASVIEESGSRYQTYPVGDGESKKMHQEKINTRGAEEEIASNLTDCSIKRLLWLHSNVCWYCKSLIITNGRAGPLVAVAIV